MIGTALYGIRARVEYLEAYLAEARAHGSRTRPSLSAAAFHATALRVRCDRALADANEAYGPRLRRVK